MELLIHIREARAAVRWHSRPRGSDLGCGRTFRPQRTAPLLAALMLSLCAASAVQSAVGTPSEYEVKAAFLLNFTKFVGWPADAFEDEDAPISICILGADPFGRTLDQMLEGEIVNDRKLAVRRISEAPRPGTCQVLFVSQADSDLYKILKQTGPGVLTVGEGSAFMEAGGMIGFVMENHRVRFDINRTAASALRLQLSSQLLNVARSVR